jgi:hypothetical protein
MFTKNIGITGSVRGIREVVDNLHYNLVGGQVYQWRLSGRKEVSNLVFRPAIRLSFPIVDDWVLISVEPGILLNIIPNETLEFAYTNMEIIEFPSKYRTVNNKNGHIFSYEMKTYLSIIIDNWSLLAGYNLSTYDLYAGRRNIIIEGDALNNHLPSKTKLCHTGFIGIGYFFRLATTGHTGKSC